MLHYKSFGEGAPLVILHGLFGMLDNWQTLARKWAADRRVILVDLRNHGRSLHHEQMDYPTMAEDVATLLESLQIDRCALLGHSMGGKVAMQTALTYPELVEQLLVIDIAPRAYRPGHDSIFAALSAFDPATVTSRKAATAAMATYVTDPGIQLFLLKNLTRSPEGGYAWRMNLPAIRNSYPLLIGPLDTAAAPCPTPTLFVRGSNSGYVRDADWPAIQALFPTARLATIPDAGHWVHAEQPALLDQTVRGFLR